MDGDATVDVGFAELAVPLVGLNLPNATSSSDLIVPFSGAVWPDATPETSVLD